MSKSWSSRRLAQPPREAALAANLTTTLKFYVIQGGRTSSQLIRELSDSTSSVSPWLLLLPTFSRRWSLSLLNSPSIPLSLSALDYNRFCKNGSHWKLLLRCGNCVLNESFNKVLPWLSFFKGAIWQSVACWLSVLRNLDSIVVFLTLL